MQQIVIIVLIIILFIWLANRITNKTKKKSKQNRNTDQKRVLYIADQDDKYGAPRSMMEMIITLKNKYNVEPVVLTSKNNDVNKFCIENNIENYVTYHQKYTYIQTNNRLKDFIKWLPRYIRYILRQYSFTNSSGKIY